MGLARAPDVRGRSLGYPVSWPPGEAGRAATAIFRSLGKGCCRRLPTAPKRNLVRLGPLDYFELRGDDSIPVPLPPPGLYSYLCLFIPQNRQSTP
jgi:hypothetical protein